MGVVTVIGVVAGVATIAISTASAIDSNNKKKTAQEEKGRQDRTIENLKASRETVKNPYKDISNPYANLTVSTQAAEFQAEEADIALANTLDTLRATGAGAGGATALAQAALQSKRNISADIEKQEVANARLKAQGAMTVQQQKAAGEQWRFATQDHRTMVDMNRAQALSDRARAEEMYHNEQMWDAIGQIPGGIMQIGGALGGGAAPTGGVTPPTGGGMWGYGTMPTGTTGAMGPYGPVSQAPPGVNVNPTYGVTGSDRRLKTDIKQIGLSPSGLKVYTFKYIDKSMGEGVWQGVMSDEVPQSVVVKDENGYDMVDYSRLDVEFKKV